MKRNSGSKFVSSQGTMANLQQFGRNLNRTPGQSSNQNPCKFVKLKQSSHTWGPRRPSSVPETCRPKRNKRNQRSSSSDTAAAGCSGRAPGFALAPRLGGRPALEQHVRPRRHLRVELARTGAGPVGSRRGTRFSSDGGALTPSQRRRGGSGTAGTTAQAWASRV